MQQPLLDNLEQPLLATDGTDNPKAEAIPLSKTGTHLSPDIPESLESKASQQDSQDKMILENKLNVIDAELTAVTELSEDDSDNTYQALTESDPYTALYSFLNSINIDRSDIQQTGISEPHLLKLYQKETGWFSLLQWCSVDHYIEKTLQWPLLSPKDVGESAPASYFKRVRPQGRSILLKSTWGLMKAYAARGFVKGVETSLAKSVHYFIYAMLGYRLVNWAMTGHSNLEVFQGLFQDSNQKGIDSLVVALAQLEARWLRLILVSPMIIGALQSITSLWSARKTSAEKLQQIIDDVSEQLAKSSRFCRDTVREKLSILPGVSALGSRVQKLEQLIRWDGRLTVEDRRKSFEGIRRAAKGSRQIAQLNALESLAKIVHGVGLKDLPRLYTARYSKADLLEILYAKATALGELEDLSQISVQTWRAKFTSMPRRVFATYLLWWLGLSASFWKQRLPFFIFKATKLTIEIFFLQKIVESILEAIRCPDKPGFKFGDGYQPWASDYTAECFTTRISLFRQIDTNESVDALVAEIPQYHLTELTFLNLRYKYLTQDETSRIIQAVIRQKAPLDAISLYYNRLSVINQEMFDGLTQLKSLGLSFNQLSTLNNGMFEGLTQLQSLDLSFNQLDILNDGVFKGLTQLNFLSLVGNRLSIFSNNVFNELTQLSFLDLSYNRLSTLSSGAFNGLTQLNYLYLISNSLSTLSPGAFNGLTQLSYLNLMFNQLGILNTSVFNGLTQLNYLDLGLNQLSILGNNVFKELTQLNHLALWGNQLSHLSNGIFNGLTQLNYLDLSYSQLNTLSNGVFSELNQLQSLYLNNNYFNTTTITDILIQLPSSLTELNIAFNQINYISQNFSMLLPISLQSLYIGGDYIPPTLTREFMQNFPKQLTHFSVEFSFISNITAGCFLDFSVLTALDLNNNQLNTLSNGAFSGLTQLNNLDLNINQLSTLSNDMFDGLTQLNYLGLSSNQLTTISNGIFNGLTQLNSLDLASNQLSALSNGIFNGLTQLSYLNLNGNKLNISNGIFNGLTQLNYLDLSGNKLDTLSNGMFNGLNQLRSLFLSSNRLNDTAIKNLTQNFPYQLSGLALDNNQISNEGALALAEILPCTNLTYIGFSNNLFDDTSIILAAQEKALRKVCEDRRCHANLPFSQFCSVSQDSAGFSKMTWGTGSSIEKIDEDSFADLKESSYSYVHDFLDSHSPAHSKLPASLSDSGLSVKNSFATPAITGTMVVGVVGFGLLLYKNATVVRNIVNTSCQLLQSCLYRTHDNLKTATNFYSFYSSFKTRTKTPLYTDLQKKICGA